MHKLLALAIVLAASTASAGAFTTRIDSLPRTAKAGDHFALAATLTNTSKAVVTYEPCSGFQVDDAELEVPQQPLIMGRNACHPFELGPGASMGFSFDVAVSVKARAGTHDFKAGFEVGREKTKDVTWSDSTSIDVTR